MLGPFAACCSVLPSRARSLAAGARLTSTDVLLGNSWASSLYSAWLRGSDRINSTVASLPRPRLSAMRFLSSPTDTKAPSNCTESKEMADLNLKWTTPDIQTLADYCCKVLDPTPMMASQQATHSYYRCRNLTIVVFGVKGGQEGGMR